MSIKQVTLYPADTGNYVAGIPHVAITVGTREAQRLLRYEGAYTDRKPSGYDGADPIDLTGQVAGLLGDLDIEPATLPDQSAPPAEPVDVPDTGTPTKE